MLKRTKEASDTPSNGALTAAMSAADAEDTIAQGIEEMKNVAQADVFGAPPTKTPQESAESKMAIVKQMLERDELDIATKRDEIAKLQADIAVLEVEVARCKAFMNPPIARKRRKRKAAPKTAAPKTARKPRAKKPTLPPVTE